MQAAAFIPRGPPWRNVDGGDTKSVISRALANGSWAGYLVNLIMTLGMAGR